MRLRNIAAVAAFGLAGLTGLAGCAAEPSGSTGGADGNTQQLAPQAAGESGATVDKPVDKAATRPGNQQNQQPVSAQERHVVRTAKLIMRVDDVTSSAASARDVAERFGGFVANERTEQGDAGLTLRVAADQLDDALAALAELGEVTHREQQADDVTEQVVDVQARIANQRASVERVRALLERANTVGEVVQIESELTTRQAELESLENRAAALSSQTELATVTVSLTARDSVSLGEDRDGFLGGLAAGWRAFRAAVVVFLTMLGAVLPFLVALGVPVLVALLVVRHRRAATRPAPPASTSAS